MVGEDGLPSMGPSERSKWKLPERGNGSGVQCPECLRFDSVSSHLFFRMFANQGRLDRHLMGYHSNFGSYHCILCGNRLVFVFFFRNPHSGSNMTTIFCSTTEKAVLTPNILSIKTLGVNYRRQPFERWLKVSPRKDFR